MSTYARVSTDHQAKTEKEENSDTFLHLSRAHEMGCGFYTITTENTLGETETYVTITTPRQFVIGK
jgi:hypothetical protein